MSPTPFLTFFLFINLTHLLYFKIAEEYVLPLVATVARTVGYFQLQVIKRKINR